MLTILQTGSKRANEPACDDHSFLSVPAGIIRHDFGVGGDVLRRELWQLVRLGMYPTQRLHLLQDNVMTMSCFYFIVTNKDKNEIKASPDKK